MDVIEKYPVSVLISDAGLSSPTDSFYRINHFLPDEQVLVTVQPDTSVGDAIKLMQKEGFSQIPVVEGDQVLGVFSYRSFAVRVFEIGQIKGMSIEDLTVDEFIEELRFVHINEDPASVYDLLDRDDAVLVGEPERLQGILTAMDVLKRLYDLANPFVLLAEIELALRSLIEISMDQDDLAVCVKNSLAAQYKAEQMPSSLQEMTFNDYIQIVGDGRNWTRFFEGIFGKGEWKRKRTRTKLEQVRDLRNDIFHFKRVLTKQDLDILLTHRDWLFMIARKVEAKREER